MLYDLILQTMLTMLLT